MNIQNNPDAPLLVSIVIPSRNEAEDIASTLHACLAIDYEPMEIIDSGTPSRPKLSAAGDEAIITLFTRGHPHTSSTVIRK